MELAEQLEARLLACDEAFSGEVVAQIERENESPAYVIEADGDRVMVPEIEGADMDVSDDVEISRDQLGDYEAEVGNDFARASVGLEGFKPSEGAEGFVAQI